MTDQSARETPEEEESVSTGPRATQSLLDQAVESRRQRGATGKLGTRNVSPLNVYLTERSMYRENRRRETTRGGKEDWGSAGATQSFGIRTGSCSGRAVHRANAYKVCCHVCKTLKQKGISFLISFVAGSHHDISEKHQSVKMMLYAKNTTLSLKATILCLPLTTSE